jgi:hypothetical protein
MMTVNPPQPINAALATSIEQNIETSDVAPAHVLQRVDVPALSVRGPMGCGLVAACTAAAATYSVSGALSPLPRATLSVAAAIGALVPTTGAGMAMQRCATRRDAELEPQSAEQQPPLLTRSALECLGLELEPSFDEDSLSASDEAADSRSAIV